MAYYIILLAAALFQVSCQETTNETFIDEATNGTDKDMYVIHATVYQVGILTNSTDQDFLSNQTGAQEALTFYHKNGSNIDLSRIPQPLLTNVTGQHFIGLAPVVQEEFKKETGGVTDGAQDDSIRHSRDVNVEHEDPPLQSVMLDSKHNNSYFTNFWTLKTLRERRSTPENSSRKVIKLEEGSAVIPVQAAIESVALPPLLSLNNNLSDIPIPIPNTSIIHYTKLSTLIVPNKNNTSS